MDRTDLVEQRESFTTAVVGAMVALLLAQPIGAALGIGDPATGHFAVVAYAALPIAGVAAALSRRWRGVLGLLVGFAVAGGIAGVFNGFGSSGDLVTDVIASGLIVMLSMGAFGAPVYLGTLAVGRAVARRRTPTPTAVAGE